MTQKGTVKSTCKHCGLPIELIADEWWDHSNGWSFCKNATKDRSRYNDLKAEPFNFNDYLKEVEL